MVLWIFSVVLALLLAAAALAVAMIRAERRARRRLYMALGLGNDAVDLLMARSGDVLTELSLLRMSPATRDAVAPVIEPATVDAELREAEAPARADAPPSRFQPAARPTRTAEGRLPANRRVPYSSRHRRT